MRNIKSKIFSLLTVLNLTFIANTAHADIVVYAPYAGKGDVCEKVTGNWHGTGAATTTILGFSVNCFYTGKVAITRPGDGKIDLNDLLLELDPTKKSTWVCPSKEKLSLSGACNNGKITIKDASSDLDGSVLEDGNTVTAHGTVTFAVPVFKKITPQVDVKLQRDAILS